ncbi:MAG: hypothetical protein EOP85_03060 [Verrucomicrobiaceae bacterium]|nr:MAG: hypothetical protein EOP85_03060 [Verrucomicrobiaceae bacterium]
MAATVSLATTSFSAFGEATVAASWDYQTVANNFDQGGTNTGVFSNNFSQSLGSFAKSTADSTIAVSATEGRVHLLNTFTIGNGTIGRFSLGQLVNATVAGGFSDRLIIVDPNRSGQSGVFTGSIRVHLNYEATAATGSRNVFGVGAGDSLASARTASQNVFYDNGGISTYAYLGFTASSPQSYNNRIVSFAVPFTFGQEFGMAVWMESNIGTEGRTSIGTAKRHNASNSVEWAGTVAVKDSSGADLAPGSFQLTSTSGQNYLLPIMGPATFQSWAARNNLTGTDAEPLADPNHNGMANLLEYAFGSDPGAAGAVGGPVVGSVVIGAESFLTLNYERPSGPEIRTDLNYTPERATLLDSSGWSSASADVVVTVSPGTGNREMVTVRSAHPSSGFAEFLRLKVSIQ